MANHGFSGFSIETRSIEKFSIEKFSIENRGYKGFFSTEDREMKKGELLIY